MNLQLGLQPFWFWNGNMDTTEITRQIEEMYTQGIPGFIIHSRQGLDIPYLSEEFFSKVKHAVACAKERSMEVWLYDEYPYPSGTSGGKVMLEYPEYCCKSLERTEYVTSNQETVQLHAPWGRLLFAKAYPYEHGTCDWSQEIDLTSYIGTGYTKEVYQQSGLTIYNPKRFFRGDTSQFLYWTAPNGNWKIYIFTEVTLRNFKYFETYIDPLNPKAIQYFIKTTHEKYKEHIGDEFGKTVKGIFTDEATAFPPEQPWSALLPDLVQKLHGIDLINNLPALFEDIGPQTAAIRYAYWHAATEGFIDSYDKQIYSWCQNNNLLYIGEKPIMRSKQLAYMDIPGIDTCHQKVGSIADFPEAKYRGNGKMVSSAAHFYDKKATLCEAFHSIGWGMTLQDMKWGIDSLALCGIDWYIVHAFFFNTDGLRKHDSPASAFYQMPWWKNMSQLATYAKRLSDFQRSIKRKIPFLLIDPVTSSWTATASLYEKRKCEFAAFQRHLLNQQIDYYIIDPELFATGTIQTKDGKMVYHIHDDNYETIILPPMSNIEPKALQMLVSFGNKGGHLVAFDYLPFEDIGYGNPAAIFSKLFFATSADATACFFFDNLIELSSHLQKYAKLPWLISPAAGANLDEIFSFTGEYLNGQPFLFIINQSQQKRSLYMKDHKQTFAFELAALESRIISSTDELTPVTSNYYEISLNQPAAMELYNENALLLKDWSMTLPDGQSALVEFIPMADQLEDSGLLQPLQQKNYFGCPKEFIMGGISATYTTSFYSALAPNTMKPIYLVIEPDTLIGDWQLFINDIPLSADDFKYRTHYLPTNKSQDIASYCHKGKNTIRLELATDSTFGGARNPLYLMGDFSVVAYQDSWKLLPFEPTGYPKNHLTSKIPFYAGAITYIYQLENLIDTINELRISDSWLQDSIQVSLNDTPLGICCWSPYRFLVPNNCIHAGTNTLKITLDTTLIGLFEGQYFDQEKHLYVDYIEK